MSNYLITGSSSGMGLAITQACLAQGDTVIGLTRNHHKAAINNNNYHGISCDLADLPALQHCLKTISQQWPHIDGIIAAAGFGKFQHLEQFSLADMQQLMTVNFMSHALIIKHFLPQFKKQAAGKIIVIGSECALQGKRLASLYAASKFALRGFCQSVRDECKSQNIAVSLINPGLVRTPFFDELNFTPGPKFENAIQAQQVSTIVLSLLKLAHNCVAEEINLQPMLGQVE